MHTYVEEVVFQDLDYLHLYLIEHGSFAIPELAFGKEGT